MDTGHLSHLFQVVLPLYVTGQNVEQIYFTSEDIHSLEMHGGTSNAFFPSSFTIAIILNGKKISIWELTY